MISKETLDLAIAKGWLVSINGEMMHPATIKAQQQKSAKLETKEEETPDER